MTALSATEPMAAMPRRARRRCAQLGLGVGLVAAGWLLLGGHSTAHADAPNPHPVVAPALHLVVPTVTDVTAAVPVIPQPVVDRPAAGQLTDPVANVLSGKADSESHQASRTTVAIVPVASSLVRRATSSVPVPDIAQSVAPVTQTLAPATQAVAPVLTPVTQTVVPVLTPVTQTVVPVLKPVTQTVAPVLKPVTQTVVPVLKPVTQTVVPVLKAVAPITRTVAPVLTPVTHAVVPVLTPVTRMVTPVAQPVTPTMALVSRPTANPVPSVLHRVAVAKAGRVSPLAAAPTNAHLASIAGRPMAATGTAHQLITKLPAAPGSPSLPDAPLPIAPGGGMPTGAFGASAAGGIVGILPGSTINLASPAVHWLSSAADSRALLERAARVQIWPG